MSNLIIVKKLTFLTFVFIGFWEMPILAIYHNSESVVNGLHIIRNSKSVDVKN